MNKNEFKTDIFGQALLDHHHGDKEQVIKVETSITVDEEITVPYLFREYDEMPEIEKTALANCKGKILDVGAGSGNHVRWLRDHNFEAWGLDRSPGAIQLMRQLGIENLIESDVMSYSGQKFDTLLMLMNGIGITGSLEGLVKYLNHAQTLLNPGGQILVESTDILYMYEQEDGSCLIDINRSYYGELDYKISYKGLSDSFPWLYISPDLLSDYAIQAGFQFELLFNSEMPNYLARLVIEE